jgi:hypothetical protein
MLFLFTFSVAVYLAGYTTGTQTTAKALNAERVARQQAEEDQQGLRDKLGTTTDELQFVKADEEFNEHRNSVYRVLKLDDSSHRKAFESLRWIGKASGFVVSQEITVRDSRLEVLLFHEPANGTPDTITTVAVLMQHREVESGSFGTKVTETKLVEVMVRESSTRLEYHASDLRDIDNDGQVDLVIDCSPGDFADRSKGSSTLIYEATQKGFVSKK